MYVLGKNKIVISIIQELHEILGQTNLTQKVANHAYILNYINNFTRTEEL